MELIMIQFSPASRYVPLRPDYLPQQTILQHPYDICYRVQVSVYSSLSSAPYNKPQSLLVQNSLAARWLAGLSLGRSGFSSRPLRVGFVVYRFVMEDVFLRVVRFSPASSITLMLHTHSLIRHRHTLILNTVRGIT